MRVKISPKLRRVIFVVFAIVGVAAILAATAVRHKTYADSLPVVNVSGDLTSDETWTSDSVYVVSNVTVTEGVTLTIDPGTIVKVDFLETGITVNSGGTLNAVGTSGSPILFTSLNDDSAGGDSADDGYTYGAPGDYGIAIDTDGGGTIDVEHSKVEYATYTTQSTCTSGSDYTFLDNEFDNTVDISSCTKDQVTLERNQFDVPTAEAMQLDGSDANIAVVSGANKNTFLGSDQSLELELTGCDVPDGSVWSVDGSSGASIVIDGTRLTLDGELDLDAGAVLKAPADGFTTMMLVDSTGTLSITGTSGDPVILTSLADDSVEGDTGGDGLSEGATGDYSQAIDSESTGTVNVDYADINYSSNSIIATNGEATFNHVNINYANNAIYTSYEQANFEHTNISNVDEGLYADTGSIVAYRGAFADVSDKSIQTCNWGTDDCTVDAAYTDWGSSDGPFATDPADDMACGAVTVSPWTYDSTNYDTSELFDVPNCDGSDTPDTQLAGAASAFEDGISAAQAECDGLGEDVCDVVNTAMACLDGAVDVAKSTVPGSFLLPDDSTFETGVSISGDVTSSASTYMRTQEATTASDLTGFGGQLLGMAGTVIALANAYNSCSP